MACSLHWTTLKCTTQPRRNEGCQPDKFHQLRLFEDIFSQIKIKGGNNEN